MKNKKLKSINYKNEDINEIKTLIIITLVIVAVAAGFYFITDKLLAKANETKESETTETSISYTETIIGEMFAKSEKEYYVFAYGSKDDKATQYNNLFSNYEKKEDGLKIYFVDMSNKFNSGFLSDKANKKPTKATEVAIKEFALILIKDGKVSKYYDDIEAIEEVLN